MTAFAPRTVQNIPERLMREPIAVWHPASMTPSLQIALACGTEDSASGRHSVRSSSPRTAPASQLRIIIRREGSQLGNQFLDLAVIEKVLVNHYPTPFHFLVVGMKFAAEAPQVLASVIEVNNLGGAGELLCADIPDPIGAVAHDHLDLRPAPATLVRFGVDPAGEFSSDVTGLGSNIR
jgi:hypothetical protein